MEEPLEGVNTTPGLPDAAGDEAAPRAGGGRPAMRAAQLWKLLGDDSPSSAAATDTQVTSAEPETPSKSWAGDELGELLARAWYDTVDEPATPAAPAGDWSQPATWEVEHLPSPSEGGIAALFGGTSRTDPAPAPPPSAPSTAPAPAGWAEPSPPAHVGSDAPLPLPSPSPEPGIGRALLAEMIDQLPTEPTPRLTPADMHIEPPVVAPVAIWFWGDDDIYPGRVASVGSPTVTAKAAKPAKPPKKSSREPRRKAFTLTRKSRPSAD